MPHYAVTIVEFIDADNPAIAKAMVMGRLTGLLNGAEDPDADVSLACQKCGNELDEDDICEYCALR